jgi:hypothetical protein
MLDWRRQRKDAIRSEIARLEKQAARLEQWQQVWGADGAAGLQKVNRELLTWLEANGAKVSRCHTSFQHTVTTPTHCPPQKTQTSKLHLWEVTSPPPGPTLK